MANETGVQRVAIVGCGGIGYALSESVVRFASIVSDHPEIYLIDGDVVEHGNMERQYFQGAINRYKSEVLAENFQEKFGCRTSITAVTSYINPESIGMHKRVWLNNDHPLIILAGVDNNPSRAYIEDQAWLLKNVTLIMGGNDDKAGQAQICMKKNGRVVLPRITSFAPDIRVNDGKLPGMGTCMRSSGSQTALANRGAAYAMEILLHGSVKSSPPHVNEIRVSTEGLMKGFWMEPFTAMD